MTAHLRKRHVDWVAALIMVAVIVVVLVVVFW